MLEMCHCFFMKHLKGYSMSINRNPVAAKNQHIFHSHFKYSTYSGNWHVPLTCYMMWWRVVNAWETMDVYIPACFLFSVDLLHIFMSSFVQHFLLHVTCRQLMSCPLTPGYSIYMWTINLSKHSKLNHKPQNNRFLHPETSSAYKSSDDFFDS